MASEKPSIEELAEEYTWEFTFIVRDLFHSLLASYTDKTPVSELVGKTLTDDEHSALLQATISSIADIAEMLAGISEAEQAIGINVLTSEMAETYTTMAEEFLAAVDDVIALYVDDEIPVLDFVNAGRMAELSL